MYQFYTTCSCLDATNCKEGEGIFVVNHTSPKALIHSNTRVTLPTNACCKSTSFLDKVCAVILGKGNES